MNIGIVGIDWIESFRPAALCMLIGKSPYGPYPHGYLCPPWIAMMLIPFAVLPERIGFALITLLCLASFFCAARKLGCNVALSVLAAAISIPVARQGNVDWLVALGLILPRPIGLFFLAAKPQVSSLVMLFWLVEEYRKGGWRKAIRTFFPFSVSLLLSFVIYGNYLFRGTAILSNAFWNVNRFWPYSILLVAVPLFAIAVWSRRQTWAILASPFLSPYVAYYSLSVPALAVLALLQRPGIGSFWVLAHGEPGGRGGCPEAPHLHQEE